MMNNFLIPRKGPVFVGDLAELKEFIEETFEKTTGKTFPKDVVIRLLTNKEFENAKAFGKSFSPNVLGFAINRKNTGLPSEIFIRKGELAQLMVTIGHELGHVISPRLKDDKVEEAKAFAFQLAWMKTIKENNIANLSTAIQLNPPAQNGIHDSALEFVLEKVKKGIDALELFGEIKCLV